MEDKKLLNLMRFWLFGTFLIVFVASTVYLGLFVNVWEALKSSFPIWGITAVLCVALYFVYKWILGRKAKK
ncbi:MAG TPA: hypothetical protein PLA25_07925 [Anaerolineaceae bacterium]|nr:hypothetical protein [Anaerolineaceae bacterium]